MSQSGFSILIPTWNNYSYLKLCVESIRKNSSFSHQILVFVNEGNDETVNWLEKNGIQFIHSETNVGICYAMNELAVLATTDYIVFLNDDMVVLPGWDIAFQKTIDFYKGDMFYLSSTIIEPFNSLNPNWPTIIENFGDNPSNFDEKSLIKKLSTINKSDWNGASWPASLVSKRIWNLVGGYSIEFSPGFYSDPDFSMKLWKYGVREFRGVGDCLVYHFGSKSTKRIRHNAGSKTFLNKWGISAKAFYELFLKMGTEWKGPLKNPEIDTLTKIRYYFKKLF